MVLLACSGYYRQVGQAIEECIGQAAKTKQVIQRADEASLRRYGGISVDVRPIGGDQRLTAVRQNENELQAAAHTRVPEYLQRLSLKWVARAGNGHPLWKLLRVGSLWWFPSIQFRTESFYNVSLGAL